MNLSDKPFYFLSKGDPAIAEYKNLFEALNLGGRDRLSINVDVGITKTKEVAMAQTIVLAMQHYPHLIPKLLFSIEFKFEYPENSGLFLSEAQWKTSTDCQRWFNHMFDFPVVPFFLRDRDACFYAFAGDMLADKKMKIETDVESDGRVRIAFQGQQLEILNNRMFNCCWLFHVFCHGSGYDPKEDIEAMLASLDSPVTYEEIKMKYDDVVRTGIEFKVKYK